MVPQSPARSYCSTTQRSSSSVDSLSIGCVSSSRAWRNDEVVARSSCFGNGGNLILVRDGDILAEHNLEREELRVGQAPSIGNHNPGQTRAQRTRCLRSRQAAELTPVCEASETPLLAVLGAGVAVTDGLLGNSPALSIRVFRAFGSGSACETVVWSAIRSTVNCLFDSVPLLD